RNAGNNQDEEAGSSHDDCYSGDSDFHYPGRTRRSYHAGDNSSQHHAADNYGEHDSGGSYSEHDSGNGGFGQRGSVGFAKHNDEYSCGEEAGPAENSADQTT